MAKESLIVMKSHVQKVATNIWIWKKEDVLKMNAFVKMIMMLLSPQWYFFSRFSLLVLSNKEFQTKLQIFFKNMAFAHSIFNYRSMNPNLEKQKFYLPSKDFEKYLITFKICTKHFVKIYHCASKEANSSDNTKAIA